MPDVLQPNELGNIIIKYNDEWRGNYYLRDDLFFTTDRSSACRFYFLKSSSNNSGMVRNFGEILNGDRITLHTGSSTICIDQDNNPKLTDRTNLSREINNFIIMNNDHNNNPISYELPILLASNSEENKFLKFEWIRKINTDNYREDFESYPTSLVPQLTNNTLSSDDNIDQYKFILERASDPISQSELSRSSITGGTSLALSSLKSDTTKGFMMIALLLVILALCVLVNRTH